MKKLKHVIAIILILLLVTGTMPVWAENGYWQGLTSRFIVFKSKDASYSGPANAKSVLYHLISEKASQERLATEANTSEEGTKLFNLVKVLNGNQVYKRFALYNGNEFNNFAGLLYETIAHGNTPVIVGIQGNESEGWPRDTERKYVLVYQITTDLSLCKVVDPEFISVYGDKEEAFYTLSIETLFQAYQNAGDGMTYSIPGAGELSDSVPQDAVNIIVADTIGKADVKKLNFELVNTTQDPVFYNEKFILERKINESDEWEEVEDPEEKDFYVNYKLAGGKKKAFSTDLLDRIDAEADTYRLSKVVVRNGEKIVIYSDSFELEK